MDMSDKDKSDIEKRNANPMNYHPPNIPSDWRFNCTSPTNPPISLLSASNHHVALGSSSSCSSAPLVDSFTHNIWDHSTNSQHMGFCEMDMQNNANTSNVMRMTKGGPVTLGSSIDRPFDMGWNPPSTMLKPGNFLSNPPGMFAQSLSQFPTDSAFIERAARFSSFSGGNFSDIVNSFGISEPVGLFPRSGATMQGPHDMFGSQSQKNEMNVGEGSKDASFSLEHGAVATDGSLLKNDRKNESFVRPSHEEAKRGVSGSGNESDEAEFSGGGGGAGQDEPIMMEGTSEGPSNKGFTPKKRKRNGRDSEIDQGKGAQAPSEAAKENNENQLKGEQNPSPSNKSGGKQGKQGSPNSDPPKEEYIHVRARRGQATNSHSLAERVRREKISERMKFLQDLVPGCSKVTGKAVMLDEIINYVQSLQRQVEFLSMKLATVNPRMDFNIEGLLAKDILQSRAGPSSSTLGFTPDMGMAFPALLPSQTGLMPATLPTMVTPSDILRRAISSQLTPPVSGGMKEHAQVSNVWDDELHNVVQMSYGSNAPPDSQDANGSLPPGPSKVEL